MLTHGTATGRVQGKALLQPGDVQVWLPWDTARASRQFLMHFKPRLGLLVDTEVWPQLVQACRRAGVPLCLVNARMSEKSWRSAMRLAPLSRPAFAGLSLVLAQSSGDAERLKILGCPHVQVAGNLKFDVQVNALSRELASRWQGAFAGRTVVMLASMREGEESLWLQALQSNPSRMEKLKARGVLWLMVPRHPQRFDAVHDLLVKAGWRCERRSSWADHEPDAIRIAATDVVLGDSLGEMQAYYLASRMALLGGSFAPFGGQNLIEAAACACPVVMGPNTFNFSDAAALAVQQGAAVQVRDMQAALEHVVLALDNPQWLDQAQAATLGVMAQGQGAVAQHVRALLAMVNAINQEVA